MNGELYKLQTKKLSEVPIVLKPELWTNRELAAAPIQGIAKLEQLLQSRRQQSGSYSSKLFDIWVNEEIQW